MARYLIESPHTPEECQTALGEVLDEGSEILEKYDWGCMAGDHRGWAIVEAESDSRALDIVPGTLRGKAHAVPINKFTPKDIAEVHKP